MKLVFLIFFTVAALWAPMGFAQESPEQAIEVAQEYLAKQLGQELATLRQEFDVDWEYLIVYEDDQPVAIKFTGVEKSCTVQVASQSLKVLDFACHASRGIEFNQSPGCGTYDGSFITLSAPQDKTSCRQIAIAKGLVDRTVMSYCSGGWTVDITQMNFVEACAKAFKDLSRRTQ